MDKYNLDADRLNVCLLGHIDHGKTTLAEAILGIQAGKNLAQSKDFEDIDKAPEHKERGVPIFYSILPFQTKARSYNLIDCPGHIDVLKDLVTNPDMINGVILVVSASDGPMAQTREQVKLASKVGVTRLVVFMNKTDMVDEEDMLELTEDEVRELLTDNGFPGDDVPFVMGSALKATEGDEDHISKISELLDQLDQNVETLPYESFLPFIMAVDDIFEVPSTKTAVITGTVEQGTIKGGDPIEILGFGPLKLATVQSVLTNRRSVDSSSRGESVELHLSNIGKDELERGMVAAKPSTLTVVKTFNAFVYFPTKAEGGRDRPMLNGFKPGFHFRTANVSGSLALPPGAEMVTPGDLLDLKITLDREVAIQKGQKFRLHEHYKTIGYGVVTEL